MYIIHNFHVVKIVIILHSSAVCHDYLFTKKLEHEITIRNNNSSLKSFYDVHARDSRRRRGARLSIVSYRCVRQRKMYAEGRM